jgi:hypothetical protein
MWDPCTCLGEGLYELLSTGLLPGEEEVIFEKKMKSE